MVLAVEGNVTQMDRQIWLGSGDHVRCGHEVGDALGRALRKMRVGDQCDVHAPWWVLGHVMAMTASQSGRRRARGTTRSKCNPRSSNSRQAPSRSGAEASSMRGCP